MGVIKEFFKKIGVVKEEELYFPEDKKDTVEKESNNSENYFFEPLTPPVVTHPYIQEISLHEDIAEKEKEVEAEEKDRIKVFSHKDQQTGNIYYEMELETLDGNAMPIATLKELPDREGLENIIKQISLIISGTRNVSDNTYRNNQIQAELKEKMQTLLTIHNVEFYNNIINLVGNIGLAAKNDRAINYREIEKNLDKTIDMSKLSTEELLEYGKILNERLRALESITLDNVYENRTGLENFMKHEEKTKTLSAIVSANLENLKSNEKPLDFHTIIAFSKQMEIFSNEDGMLYSSYLKLEENRIIRRIQQDIISYNASLEEIQENFSTKDLADGFVEYLETTKTGTEIGNKDNITSYMIDTLQGRGIENYLSNMAKQDIKLKKFLKNNEVENAEKSGKYIEAKLACLGQVVDVTESSSNSREVPILRDFIEQTDYKDEDISEIKNFLYVVAKIEEDYIKKNYEPVLRKFKEIVEQKDVRKQGEDR